MILFDTGIYKLTHKESGKVYIGQSKHLKRRLNEHKRCEKSDETKSKMSEHRKEFIKNNPDSCKNFLGKQHSDETKKLMSEKHFGILHTNESKLKMSDMAKNRKRVYQEDGSWKWGKLCL